MSWSKPSQRQMLALQILIRTTDAGKQASLREIGIEMGISSTNGVADHLLFLSKKGYVEYRHSPTGGRSPRAVRILLHPDGTTPYRTPSEKLATLLAALGLSDVPFETALELAGLRAAQYTSPVLDPVARDT